MRLVAIAAAFALATMTHAQTPLATTISTLLADPAVSHAHWGIQVTTLDGTPLYSLDEAKLFRPSSTAKLFTTAAAMALLGPEKRVTTVLTADAPPDSNGVLRGNLVLHGAGDANLSGRRIPYEEPADRKRRLAAEKSAAASASSAYAAAHPPPANCIGAGCAEDIPEDTSVPPELAPMEDLAAQLAAAGFKQLAPGGFLVGDNDLWRRPEYNEHWDAGDTTWGYAAPVSALSFNDNEVDFHVQPSLRAGDSATYFTVPAFPFFGVVNQVTTVTAPSEAGVSFDKGPINARLTLRGAVALGHPDTEAIAVENPALFAVDALASRLYARHFLLGSGTRVQDEPRESTLSFLQQLHEPVDLTFRPDTSPVCGREFQCGIVLARHDSPTVAEDVTVTLKTSQNLHAEMLLRRLGRAYGKEGSFSQGARVVRQYLLNAGLQPDSFLFYDGSGLSGEDLVTPRATAKLLAYAATQPWFPQWRAALPIGGVDGTLADRFKEPPLKGHVFAKTGTLGESRALAGYLDAASGQTLIFAIYVDNHTPGSSADRVVMDKIVAAIAAAN